MEVFVFLGGTLGLFSGISILSMFEAIFWLTRFLRSKEITIKIQFSITYVCITIFFVFLGKETTVTDFAADAQWSRNCFSNKFLEVFFYVSIGGTLGFYRLEKPSWVHLWQNFISRWLGNKSFAKHIVLRRYKNKLDFRSGQGRLTLVAIIHNFLEFFHLKIKILLKVG